MTAIYLKEMNDEYSNLINNAIKFTDAGNISIRLKTASKEKSESEEQKSTSPMILMEVEDTGVGITAENKSKIFDRFRQGNHKRSGHGLGLYLCHQIIQSHHGRIEVESERGKGSVFKIFLPVDHSL